jgi:UDP-glucose 4-epimerase
MNQRILIAGGAGFIGSHLSEKLLKLGDEVFIIDNLSTGCLSNIENIIDNKKFHYVIESILNKPILEDLIKKIDTVVHLAAAVGVKYIIDNPLLSLETNITGTENILCLANKHKKKVFIASTSEIYGKNDKDALKEEDDRILGSTYVSRWSYAATKSVNEFLALAYFREKKIPIIIGRIFNTIGPRQSEKYGMVVPRFVKQALLNHPITVYGDGRQRRCFTSVDDTANAIIKLINCPKAIGEIFNIGSTNEISIKDLAKKIKILTNSISNITYLPYDVAYERGFEDMMRRKPDISKIKKYIDFSPQNDLDEIIINMINHFKS